MYPTNLVDLLEYHNSNRLRPNAEITMLSANGGPATAGDGSGKRTSIFANGGPAMAKYFLYTIPRQFQHILKTVTVCIIFCIQLEF